MIPPPITGMAVTGIAPPQKPACSWGIALTN